MKHLILIFVCLIIFNISAQEKKDNPIINFEKLWSEFNDRYANFELKTVNWDNNYKEYRPQINKNTSSKELFDVSCKMLQELKDGHVNIIINKNNITEENWCGSGKKFHILEEFSEFDSLKVVVKKTLKKKKFSPLINQGKIIQYSVSEKYGYLRIDGMEGFKIGELSKVMKSAINIFENKKGVIIDVRFNGGGEDKVSYQIAGRFTDKKRLGHYKRTRIKGTKAYTELDSWYLKPKGSKQFTKPIIVLTSDWSASATEIFVMAMKELPYVTIVGDNTEGIFSDMYFFKLPNKWRVSLSHQQYFSTDMKNYEGIGIPPDYKVLNYKKDKSDLVLAKAIEILDNNTN
ncbi:MAG: hypothetical protein CMC18_01290 [Flavobacteriaceae bacterium]|nr:hypothetical protein [Flavobacteriaceae bacterium]